MSVIDDHDPKAEKESDYQSAIADVEILCHTGDVQNYFGEGTVSDHLLAKIERLWEGNYGG